MPINQSKGRTGRQRKFLSKSSMLPMVSASERQLALTHHLGLAACRGNGGDKHLINELTRAVYLTYFLQQMGFGALPFDAYMKAEAAISTALKNAERDGDWRIALRDASSLEEILAVHDEQLANAPQEPP
jgi:hypothetical protein